jgi:hypothetical protein
MESSMSAIEHGALRDDHNRLWMIDVRLTWHITQYVKMFFSWNHAEFNDPMFENSATKKTFTTSNTLWWRIPLYTSD